MKPAVGQVVHYVDYGRGSSQCLAAIIVQVYSQAVELIVFPPSGQPYHARAEQSEGPEFRHWHQPERLE